VSGNVKSKKIGLINALTKARIITARIAEKNPSRLMLSKSPAVRTNATALSRILITVR
jgi:hypothetical protein